MEFKDKRVVLTGCIRGLGKEIDFFFLGKAHGWA